MISKIAEAIVEVLGKEALHRWGEHVVIDAKSLTTALTYKSIFRSRRIRVSMAQILSLRLGDKFVLINNARQQGRVTPIGGVVRYFPSAVAELESHIGFEPEFKDGQSRYDLRGYLTGKELTPFLKWYGTGRGRERFAIAREIEEELAEIGIADVSDHLKRPEFVQKRIVFEGPSEVEKRKHWQYRQLEVLELQEESDVSKELADFIRSKAKRSRQLVLATTDEILRGTLHDGRLFGTSAGYLFGGRPIGIPPLFEKH